MGDEERSSPRSLTLSAAEHALYSAGIRRGHGESLRQLSRELKTAAATARRGYLPEGEEKPAAEPLEALAGMISGYERFAAQLDEPAEQAGKEQQRLLDLFERFRAAERRALLSRLGAAWRGALGGWRGG